MDDHPAPLLSTTCMRWEVCVCVCVCVFMYIHIQRHTQTDRHTHTHTHTHIGEVGQVCPEADEDYSTYHAASPKKKIQKKHIGEVGQVCPEADEHVSSSSYDMDYSTYHAASPAGWRHELALQEWVKVSCVCGVSVCVVSPVTHSETHTNSLFRSGSRYRTCDASEVCLPRAPQMGVALSIYT